MENRLIIDMRSGFDPRGRCWFELILVFLLSREVRVEDAGWGEAGEAFCREIRNHSFAPGSIEANVIEKSIRGVSEYSLNLNGNVRVLEVPIVLDWDLNWKSSFGENESFLSIPEVAEYLKNVSVPCGEYRRGKLKKISYSPSETGFHITPELEERLGTLFAIDRIGFAFESPHAKVARTLQRLIASRQE